MLPLRLLCSHCGFSQQSPCLYAAEARLDLVVGIQAKAASRLEWCAKSRHRRRRRYRASGIGEGVGQLGAFQWSLVRHTANDRFHYLFWSAPSRVDHVQTIAAIDFVNVCDGPTNFFVPSV